MTNGEAKRGQQLHEIERLLSEAFQIAKQSNDMRMLSYLIGMALIDVEDQRKLDGRAVGKEVAHTG